MFMRRDHTGRFLFCGDEKNPRLEFQRAVIKGVSEVTHIAPADPDGTIIGSKVVARRRDPLRLQPLVCAAA